MPLLVSFISIFGNLSTKMTTTKLHCFLCFEAIENFANKTNKNAVKRYFDSQNITQKQPMFVTWTKNGALRGCIGCFSKQPIVDGLCTYAVIAGGKDPRFPPITSDELENLTVSVSLLHSFEQCEDPFDWTIGKHGLIFTLGNYDATFLPQVAEEEKWTKEQTIERLAMKSGYRKKLTKEDYKRITMERYQTSKETATWKEYQNYLNSLK